MSSFWSVYIANWKNQIADQYIYIYISPTFAQIYICALIYAYEIPRKYIKSGEHYGAEEHGEKPIAYYIYLLDKITLFNCVFILKN